MAAKKKGLVRYRTRNVTRWRTRRVKAKPRRRRSPSRSRAALPKDVMIAAAAIGYLKEQTKAVESLPEALQPSDAKGQILLGAVMHFAAKDMIKSPWMRHGADAMLTIGAYNLGQGGFKLSGDHGGEDDDYISGEM